VVEQRTGEVRHPLFARFFDRLAGFMERELGDFRGELLSGLSGRVLEVGAGNGMNFRHYPPGVDAVVALEPEAYLRGKAEQAARRATVDVQVLAGVAHPLPIDHASMDAAVASLVLCTVPDPRAALSEILRALRPGAELRFMEHVRSRRARKAGVQEWFDRSGLWPRVAGGCHCSRDTVSVIEQAGFQIESVREFELGPSWGLTNPHVIGTARRPSA
jgi:SAM-dependent methyltransferase